MPRQVEGQRILATARRAKYLLFVLDSGTLLLHLGMSGSLRVLPLRLLARPTTMLISCSIRANPCDSMIRGALAASTTRAAPRMSTRCSCGLRLSLSDRRFNPHYLWSITRRRRIAIKQLLMNSRLVVGVGNIYANEALFRARIRPQRRRAACHVSKRRA